ncbi:MAG: AI-2E family transporter [Candidatus Aminicenantia bacterium]
MKRNSIIGFSVNLLSIAIFLLIFKFFSKIFFPLIISFYFYYALEPISLKLSKTFLGRNGGPLLTVLLLILFVSIIFASFIPTIVSQTKDFFSNLPELIERGISSLDYLLKMKPKEERGLVSELRNQFLTNIRDSVSSIINAFPYIGSFIFKNLNSLFLFVLYLFIIPFFTFYLLKDFNEIKKRQFLNKNEIFPRLNSMLLEFDFIISNFIRGQLTICFIVAILYSIGLLIIGVPFALLLGVIGGIGDIIPYLGTYTALVLSILVSLTYSPSLKTIIFILLLFAVVKGIDNFILSPRILGKSSGLHPVVVIVSIFIGGKILGVMGMLLAIPVSALIKIILRDLIEGLSSAS